MQDGSLQNITWGLCLCLIDGGGRLACSRQICFPSFEVTWCLFSVRIEYVNIPCRLQQIHLWEREVRQQQSENGVNTRRNYLFNEHTLHKVIYQFTRLNSLVIQRKQIFSCYNRHLVSPSLGHKLQPTCYFRRDISLILSEPLLQVPFGNHMLAIQEGSCPNILQSKLPDTYNIIYECYD